MTNLTLVLCRPPWYGRVTGSEAVTHVAAFDRRCLVDTARAAVATIATPPLEDHGAAPHSRPRRINRDPVRASNWNPVADAPEGNGVWIRQYLLAAMGSVAT